MATRDGAIRGTAARGVPKRGGALLLALVCACAPHQAQGRWNDVGRFVVAKVLVDPATDNAAARFVADDPRLLGRFVTIAADRLAIDGDYPCTRIARRWTKRSVADLLKAALPRRSPNQKPYPSPADLGLTGVPAGAVDMVAYRCTGPDDGKPGGIPGHGWTGVTAFPLDGARRGLLWENEVVLQLAPAAAAPAQASFDCRRAAAAVEKAICGDPALASWDRSVATAFRLLRDGNGDVPPTDDPAALVASQRAWMTERNRCGTDRTCLEDRMAERTDALMRRQY